MYMTGTIKVHAGLSNPQSAAAEQLSRILHARSHSPVLLLLSGGSALDVADYLKEKDLGGHVTVSVVDDRYSTDPEVNNFAQLKKRGISDQCENANVDMLHTEVKDGESLGEYARRYESQIKHWFAYHPAGVIIALLGIGSDGHTAGILPHPDNKPAFHNLFEDEETFVVGYDAGDKNKYALRATVTNYFLRKHVHYAVAFVSGDNKRDALEATLSSSGELHVTPARILKEMRDVTLYTDLAVSHA